MSEELKSLVERTAGICGGRWRVAGTRLAIWVLHEFWRYGATDDEILAMYPQLSRVHLQAVRICIERHKEDIDRDVSDHIAACAAEEADFNKSFER